MANAGTQLFLAGLYDGCLRPQEPVSHLTHPEMSDYDPIELLAVCDIIIEDGELTYDELYGLAEWLNHHPEAFPNWPGNVLAEPLQRIWADGKITKTEAREMARLIRKIQKQAAKFQEVRALTEALEAATLGAAQFDLSQPRLPSIPFSTRIKSHTDRKLVYDVDLSGPTCTCPDFKSFRQRLPNGHLTRCCKHVFDAYSQAEPPMGWPGWLRAYLDLAWKPHPQQEWTVIHVDHSLVLISTAMPEWSNVFASDRGPYDRFGYSVSEDRWAYSIAPPQAHRISRAVRSFSKA
jgi:hypothetical protein